MFQLPPDLVSLVNGLGPKPNAAATAAGCLACDAVFSAMFVAGQDFIQTDKADGEFGSQKLQDEASETADAPPAGLIVSPLQFPPLTQMLSTDPPGGDQPAAELAAKPKDAKPIDPLALIIDADKDGAPIASASHYAPPRPPPASSAPIAIDALSSPEASDPRESDPVKSLLQDRISRLGGRSLETAAPEPPLVPRSTQTASPEAALREFVVEAAKPRPSTAAPLVRTIVTHSQGHQIPTVAIISSRQSSDGSIEMRLDPPDLGTIRIELAPDSQAGVTRAVIIAERPETLDLVRRHIDVFRQELSRQGFADVQMTLSDRHGDRGQPHGSRSGARKPSDHDVSNYEVEFAFAAPVAASGLNVIA
jgi:hypothetical protein